MSVDNVRPALFENKWQSVVHAVIESGPFAQVPHFYPSLLKQTVQVATQTARERNDRWFKTLTVQSPHDMNRHTLSATGAYHRHNMDHFDLLHDLSYQVGSDISLTISARTL